ncbi:MAG: hypothetical protein AAB367_04640 [Patescibacteria group bacterium]
MFKRIPWALLLVLGWIMVRHSGVDLSVEGVAIWPFVGVSFVTLMAEFYRSGDIMILSYKLDQTFAVVATLVLGYGLSLAVQDPHVLDLLVAAVVLADAIISPVNSFRTALRNMQAGVDTTAADA